MDEFQVDAIFSNNQMINVKAVINDKCLYDLHLWRACFRKKKSSLKMSYTFCHNEKGFWFMIDDFNEQHATMRKKEDKDEPLHHFFRLTK